MNHGKRPSFTVIVVTHQMSEDVKDFSCCNILFTFTETVALAKELLTGASKVSL